MNSYPVLKVSYNTEALSGCYYKYVNGCNDLFYPHSHDYYEIFVTVSGVVHHWVNGEVQQLPEGTLVFIRPNDTHGYVYDDEESRETTYINLAFTKEIADSLFCYLSDDDFPVNKLLSEQDPPMVILTPTAKDRLIYQLSRLNTLDWENKKALKLHVKTILAEVFVQNFYSISRADTTVMPQWFQNLLKEMEQVENFTTGTSRMVELSEKSYEHLSRTAKKYLNFTLTEYINKLRVNYAANLLLNSNNSIIDICYMCGFQNLGYFYKIFNKEYGLSPSRFRERHKSN